tara:strand:+ start:1879 stop:1989 length:111 start_codon:yes stop_codon:yes gene_type:complete
MSEKEELTELIIELSKLLEKMQFVLDKIGRLVSSYS